MKRNRQQKLKNKALRRQDRRERKEKQAFTEPLTGKRARRISKAEANMAYKPTERAIKGEIRASRQQQRNVGNWYQQFANEIAGSRDQVAGAYNQANAAIAGTMQTAAAHDAARSGAVDAQAADFAALTGGPIDTPGASTAAAAANQRQLYGAAIAAPVATQGANAYAYLTNQRNTARGEGIHQKIQERKRRQSLQQDRKALLKEKGQYRVSKLGELRDKDRDYKIQQKAFSVDERSAAAAAAQDAAEARQRREENIEDNRTSENNNRRSSRPEANDNGLTPTQRREVKQDRRSAMAAGWRVIKANGVPKSPKEWAGLEAIIAEEEGIDAAQARQAVKRIKARVANRQGGGAPTGPTGATGRNPR